MYNNIVFEIIKTLCIEKEDPHFYDLYKVYIAIAHGYYFVRPGKNTRKFIRELNSDLVEGIKEGANNCADDKRRSSISDYIRVSVAKHALKTIRKSFDLEFFEAQSVTISNDKLNPTFLLTKYLNKMSNDQLHTIQGLIDTISCQCSLFLDESTCSFLRFFSYKCRDIDDSVPDLDKESRRWLDFIQNNPKFAFDYLDKADITKAINTLITRNRAFAANMVRALYYTDDRSLCMDYAFMIHDFERMCNVRPFAHYVDSNQGQYPQSKVCTLL